MAGTNWTVFTAGSKAKATEVNENFDWMEGHFKPQNAGSTTTGVYDLGSSTERWRVVYANSLQLSAQSSFRAYRSGSEFTVPNTTTASKVEFNSESFDVVGEYNTASFNFTAITGGKYLATSVLALLSATVSNAAFISIYIDDTISSQDYGSLFLTGGSLNVRVTDIIDLTAGSVVDIRIRGHAGLKIDFDSQITWFSMHKLA